MQTLSQYYYVTLLQCYLATKFAYSGFVLDTWLGGMLGTLHCSMDCYIVTLLHWQPVPHKITIPD